LKFGLTLSEEQLLQNGFLMPKEGEPGKFSVFFDPGFSFNVKWNQIVQAELKGKRYCTRCHNEYEYDPEDLKQIREGCRWHALRLRGPRNLARGMYVEKTLPLVLVVV